MKMRIRFLVALTCLLVLINFTTVNAQSLPAIGDFQSYQTGYWRFNSTWSRWNGSQWVNPAPHIPTFEDGKITILEGHNILLYTYITVDELTVDAGGKITAIGILTVNAGSGTPDMVVNGTLEISSGEVAVNGEIVLSSGSTLETPALNGVKGSITGPGIKTFSAGANYIFNRTSAQSTGFSGLLVGNPGSITIDNNAGVTLDTSITVTGTLTFTNGKLITGAHTLTMGETGSVIGADIGKYIYGNLSRALGSSGSPTISFDIGDATNYAPVSIAINSLSAGGTLKVSTTGNKHGSMSSSKISDTKYVNRYWTLTNSGVICTDYSAIFNFVSGDIIGGADPNNFIAGKHDGNSWSYPTVGMRTSTSTQISGESSFSDFAVGEIKTYTITASAAANGSINPPGVTYVPYGDSVIYSITPITGYAADTVLVDGSYVGAVTSYTFTNVTANHTINAAFFIKTYTLAINAENGTVTKNPDQAEYDSSSIVRLTAYAATGYHFTGWSGDITESVNPVNVSMDANKNITANFAFNTYTINVNMIGNGSVDKNPDQAEYDSASTVSLTARPGVGYYFTGWSGDVTDTINPIAVMIDGNKNITANFAIKTYTLTIQEINCTVTKIPNQTAHDSSSFVQLTVTPYPGFTFIKWIGDLTGTTNPVYIKMDANKTVTAICYRIINFLYREGWNLVSVPLLQTNYAADDIFPNSFGDLIWYNSFMGAYSPVDTLELGKGYWANNKYERSMTILGTDSDTITIDCKAGWNLIGSCELPVNVSSLVLSNGAEIEGGAVYSFIAGKGYKPQSIIYPGQGVWAYISADCTITIP